MRRFVTVLAAAVCLLAALGCGDDDDDRQACVILANGNKLCDGDATAYCRTFGGTSTGSPLADLSTRRACETVGVTLPEPPTERETPERETTPNHARGVCMTHEGVTFEQCTAAAEAAAAVGETEISPDAISCMRRGDDPAGCVERHPG